MADNPDKRLGQSVGNAAQTTAKTAVNAKNNIKRTKAAGKAISKGAKVFAANPIALKILGIIFLINILIAFFAVVIFPALIGNPLTHIDNVLNPWKDEETYEIDENTFKSEEEKYADIIEEFLAGTSHDDIYDKIKKQCKKNGVDYEATQDNIIDSVDYLGDIQAKDKGEQYQNEQDIYNKLTKKGYSVEAASACLGAMSYLTDIKVDNNFIDFDKQHGSLAADSMTNVGIFKFSFSKFEMYLISQNKDKSLQKNLTKLKNLMYSPEVQADYFDYLMQENMGGKAYKKFYKATSVNTAINYLTKYSSPQLKNNKEEKESIKYCVEVFKEDHLIGQTKATAKNSSNGGLGETTDIMASADSVSEKLHARNFVYHFGGYNHSYTSVLKRGPKYTDCAGYISYALQNAEYLKNGQIIYCRGRRLRGSGESTLRKKFTVREGLNKSVESLVKSGELQPGDIVGATGTHTMMYKGKKDGQYYFYSWTKKWVNRKKSNNATYSKDYRIGVIIRAKNGVTGTASKESSGANRALASITRAEQKSNYPASTINSYKKTVEGIYKNKKKDIDAAYKELLAKGCSPAAAAGILGNAYQESGWRLSAVSGDGYGSQGLFQWTFGRLTKFKKWMSQNKKKIGNEYVASIDYIFVENDTMYGPRTSNYHGFWSVKPFSSQKDFKGTDDVLRATVSFCANWERCDPSQANMANRYAAAQVVLEQCAGITSDGTGAVTTDNTGAGSRQMALLIAAFSIKESQLYPKPEVDENGHEVLEVKKGETFEQAKLRQANNKRRTEHPEKDLKKCLKKKKAELFEVEYGDIIENEDGKKIYASVEIKPASANKIIKDVFEMNPKDIYKTEEGDNMGADDTTIEDATLTLADNHMEVLYGNHEYGALGDGEDSLDYANNGSGKFGSPLGNILIGSSKALITSIYGPRTDGYSKFHEGIDVGIPTGTKLYASRQGKVILSQYNDGYGYCVIIQHDKTYTTYYAHMSKLSVKKGQQVKRGQLIGLSGNTGWSTGAHLHYGIKKNGKFVDPMPYLKTPKKKNINVNA